MKKYAYYNEIDPFAAQWLRELIKAGHIAPGDVDERSIEDVLPSELVGYTQCHFFAGIGVWSYALRAAGWPDGRAVWTGSCPCQPFSQAGKGEGFADERHLWPAWHWLISQCKPDAIFGEQVESPDGRAWLDLVQDDLEAAGYAIGAIGLPACGFGAPHIRERLFFVADAYGMAKSEDQRYERGGTARRRRNGSSNGCNAGGMDNAKGVRSCSSGPGFGQSQRANGASRNGDECGMGNADNEGSQGWQLLGAGPIGIGSNQCLIGTTGATRGFWGQVDWIVCRDPDGPRIRPVEPGTFPLAHGAPARVGRLRGYGNAIVAEVAKEFIQAYLEEKEAQR